MAAIDVLFDVAAEFATTDATALARVNRFIEREKAKLDKAIWGDLYDEAVALKAAHELALAAPGRNNSQVGPVISEKVGDLSRGYANPTAPNANLDPLDTTSYGQRYKQLRGGVYVGGHLL